MFNECNDPAGRFHPNQNYGTRVYCNGDWVNWHRVQQGWFEVTKKINIAGSQNGREFGTKELSLIMQKDGNLVAYSQKPGA